MASPAHAVTVLRDAATRGGSRAQGRGSLAAPDYARDVTLGSAATATRSAMAPAPPNCGGVDAQLVVKFAKGTTESACQDAATALHTRRCGKGGADPQLVVEFVKGATKVACQDAATALH